MEATDLLLARNGHFDPFTLSIYESAAEHKAWRERVGQVDASVRSNLFAARGAGREPPAAAGGGVKGFFSSLLNRGGRSADDVVALRDGQGMRRDDLTASLVSIHENDHFIRHSSNEIGLLLTLLLQLRYAAQVGYYHRAVLGAAGPVEECESTISLLNLAFRSLWSYDPDITQRVAVNALNTFFRSFEVEGPVFTTANPDAPHCPDPHLTYRNILETSAVIKEVSRLDFLRTEGSFAAERLLGYFRYDYPTYGATLQWLFEQVHGYIPAATFAASMCMEARVPVIGSPYAGPIDWQNFHPGYRLVGYGYAARSGVEKLGLNSKEFDAKFAEDPLLMHADILLDPVYEYINWSAAAEGRLTGWDDPAVDAYETNLDLLIERMSQFGRDTAGPTLRGRASLVLTHLFEAFESFKQMRRTLGLGFYTSVVRLKPPAEGEDAGPAVFPQEYFALFSIFDKQIESYHLLKKPEAVLGVISQYFTQQMLDRLLRGEEFGDVLNHLRHGYTFENEGLTKSFWEFFEGTVSFNLGPSAVR